MPVRLFIGNLPYAASEAELREHLSSVGEPTQIVLPVDRETGRPRGFAFVDYADRAVAEAAISRFDQQPFKGRPLAVSEARPREERPAGAPAPRWIWRSASWRGAGPGGGGFAPRPSGWAPRPEGGGGGERRPQSQFRSGCAAQEQAQATAEGLRSRSKGSYQGASGEPSLRERRRLAKRAEGRSRNRRHRDERATATTTQATTKRRRMAARCELTG